MKKLLFLMSVCLISGVGTYGQLNAADKVTLQLRWDHQFQFAGYYAAKWQGFYDEVDLDVEIKSAITPKGILSAVEEVGFGRADFGIGAADILIARGENIPLVLVASIFQHSAAGFYTRKETDIDSPADLLKLKVARNVNDLIDIELQALLKAEGIDPELVTPYRHQPGLEHLISGKVDVIPGYSITVPYAAKEKEVLINEYRPIKYGIDFYGDSIFTHKRLVEDNPDLVKRFKDASIRGWEYALNNREELVNKITHDLNRVQTADNLFEFNRYQSQALVKLLHFPEVKTGHINPDRWEKMHQYLKAIGLLKNPINLEEFIFDPEKLIQIRIEKRHRILTWIASILIFTLILSSVWLIVLRRTVKNKTKELTDLNKRLSESETKYRGIVGLSPLGIWMIDKDSNTSFVNPSMAKLLGYSPDEMIGKHLFSFMDEKNIEIAKSNIKRSKQGIRERHDFQLNRKDGTQIYTTMGTAPLNDDDGNYIGAIASVADITDRLRAEERIRHLNAILRAIRGVNQLIVREKDLHRLIQGVCEILISTRGYYNAWAALFDDNGSLEAVECGLGKDFLALAERLKQAGLKVSGQKVLEQSGPMIVEDPASTCGECPLATKYEGRSGIRRRLNYGGKHHGILTVSLPRHLAFDPEELSLFNELADDISYAIKGIESEAERKQMEEELLESEERYRTLVEMSPEAVYVHIEEKIVYINNEAAKTFGATAIEEVIGRSIFDINHIDYHEAIRARIKQIQKEQKPAPWAEMKITRLDGRVIDIETTGTVITYLGKPAVMSLVRDITEKRMTENKLRESEKELQGLFDEAPIGYHEYDDKGRITRVNRTELEMLGYSAEEMLGRFAWEFFVEKEAARQSIEAKLSGEKSIGGAFERTIRRKDGTTFPILTENLLLKDTQGRVTGIRSTIQDITELKQAQESLKKEEEKFRILVEESPLGVSMIGKDGRYLYVNPKFVEMFGYDIKEIPTGRQWFRKAFPDKTYRNQVISMWLNDRKESKEKVARPRKFPVACKDGTEKVVYFIPVMMKTGDEFILYDDITEHEKLATQLQQAQKMEAVGTLAGGIAHDFNNILSAIIGYGELAMDGVADGTDLKYKLQEIINAGYRARDLIKQILSFSRQAEQEIKPISIKYIAKEALKMLRATIPSTIEIRDEIRSDKTIMGDPIQIHQVIMNLFTNSAHAMQERGGVLTLSLEDREIISESETKGLDISPGLYQKLAVRDTGRGIPADIIDKIFDPYFTTKENDGGTGLGLSVVHGIVKSLGGAVTVYSEPEKGTTFEIYLPAIQTEAETQEKIQTILPKGTEHILIVDDEKAVVDIEKQSLEKQGYRVTTRTSSVEALELFKVRSGEFDLLVTDLTMPNMTGLTLSKEIKNIRPDIPIILCSGFAEQVSKMSFKQHGIETIVRKPIGRNELIQTVRKVLDKKSD